MSTYKSESDGTVFAMVNGEWEEIGKCGKITVEYDEDETDKEAIDRTRKHVQDMIGPEFTVFGMSNSPIELDDMAQFVYYEWLHRRYPTLYWN